MTTQRAEKEVLARFDSLSNRGRWGSDDQLGTLNLITPQVRRRAAALASEGIRVSCCWNLRAGWAGPLNLFMRSTGQRLAEQHRVVPPMSHLLWDSHGHGVYGRDRQRRHRGLRRHVHQRSAPGRRRSAWSELAGARLTVYSDDLRAAEELAGLRAEQGDAGLVRTGNGRRRQQLTASDPLVSESQAGLHAAMLPWPRERDVAVVGCDTGLEVVPTGYPKIVLLVDATGIVAMGLWSIYDCDLEQLTITCADLPRWEFLFFSDPPPIVGATGSPINPRRDVVTRSPMFRPPADDAGTRSRSAAPNVVLLVLDDLGFADLGCYGSAVATPNIDRLAQAGLRYDNYAYDPGKVKQQLAAAGYPDGFTLRMINNTDRRTDGTPVTQALAQEFSVMGVELDVTSMNSQAHGSAFFSGEHLCPRGTTPHHRPRRSTPNGLRPGGFGDQHGWQDPVLEDIWSNGMRAAKPEPYLTQLIERTVEYLYSCRDGSPNSSGTCPAESEVRDRAPTPHRPDRAVPEVAETSDVAGPVNRRGET